MALSAAARLTRRSGTSFYYAFRILPPPKRKAIYALYALCRALDDCVDEEAGEGEAGLARWMEEVERCYAGQPTTDLGRELSEALALFPIPRSALQAVAEGCRMDLTVSRYETFADLRRYCERVASAVGLASIEIFGYRDPRTREYATELGVALQLTNILRDLSADAARGRLYLPREDLVRFGVDEPGLLAALGRPQPAPALLRPLLSFQARRAQHHYDQAAARLPDCDRRAMIPAEAMAGVYRVLLAEFVRRGYPLGQRLSLSRARKAWIALRTMIVRRLWP